MRSRKELYVDPWTTSMVAWKKTLDMLQSSRKINRSNQHTAAKYVTENYKTVLWTNVRALLLY